jgi:hypothetical protein
LTFCEPVKLGKRYIATPNQTENGGNSQTCICGAPVPKELKDRIHHCPVCGLTARRDHVAVTSYRLSHLELQVLPWERGHTLRRPGRSSSDVERTKRCVAKAACASRSASQLQSLPGSVNLHRRCDEVPRVRKLPWEARLDHHALRIVMALLREP